MEQSNLQDEFIKSVMKDGPIRYNPPIAAFINQATISSKAEKIRKKADFKNGFDLLESDFLATMAKVNFAMILDEISPYSMTVHPDNHLIIEASEKSSALENHFTVARSIGHFALHWPEVKKICPKNVGMRVPQKSSNANLVQCEQEAHWFALAFLMPEAEFREAWPNGSASEKFGVTQWHAVTRARDLGLDIDNSPGPA